MFSWKPYNYFTRILIIFQYKNFFLIFTNKNITTSPLFYFTKWYIRKLYGRHIDKLKEMLNDLNEESTHN
jgi:hypothetical protein